MINSLSIILIFYFIFKKWLNHGWIQFVTPLNVWLHALFFRSFFFEWTMNSQTCDKSLDLWFMYMILFIIFISSHIIMTIFSHVSDVQNETWTLISSNIIQGLYNHIMVTWIFIAEYINNCVFWILYIIALLHKEIVL
jgi:hypothetical protein